MRRAYYSDSIAGFLAATTDTMIGRLARASEFPVEQSQRLAWERQIEVLRPVVEKYEGAIYFEYSIPRMGERIDVVLLIGSAIFVLEFKVEEETKKTMLQKQKKSCKIFFCFFF